MERMLTCPYSTCPLCMCNGEIIGLLHRRMLTLVLAMSLCCYIETSTQCSAWRQRWVADFRLAGCQCDFSVQPATVRVEFGIRPFIPNILLLLFGLSESSVSLLGAETLSSGSTICNP